MIKGRGGESLVLSYDSAARAGQAIFSFGAFLSSLIFGAAGAGKLGEAHTTDSANALLQAELFGVMAAFAFIFSVSAMRSAITGRNTDQYPWH